MLSSHLIAVQDYIVKLQYWMQCGTSRGLTCSCAIWEPSQESRLTFSVSLIKPCKEIQCWTSKKQLAQWLAGDQRIPEVQCDIHVHAIQLDAVLSVPHESLYGALPGTCALWWQCLCVSWLQENRDQSNSFWPFVGSAMQRKVVINVS